MTRPDREVPECYPFYSAMQILQRLVQLQKLGAAQFQLVFIRLINSSNGIVQIRRARLLNVIPQNVGDDLPVREVNQPLNAAGKRRRVFHVKPPRVQAVPGEQNACLPVIDGNG